MSKSKWLKRASFLLLVVILLCAASYLDFLATKPKKAGLQDWIASFTVPGPLHWYQDQDFDKAGKEGERRNKYVLVVLHTKWCAWCKTLEEDTFGDKDFIRFLNSNCVCVKADAEDHGTGQRLATEHSVAGYPCALLFDSTGKFIGRIPGYANAAEYQKLLEELLFGRVRPPIEK